MPNLLDQGLSQHRSRLNSAAGDDAIYYRANYRIPIRVVAGQSTWTDAQSEDIYNELKLDDFIILDPSKLKIGDEEIEPQRGDWIEYRGYNYRVISGPAGVAWSYSEGRGTFYRIHTTRVGRVASQ